MEASSLFKPNITQELISTMIRSMLFAAYADVMEVKEDYVVVQGSVCENLMPFTASAKVVYPTTANVSMVFEPSVGDKVLVIGLQAYNDDMFKSKVPIIDTKDTPVQHYTLLGCVAIPMNIRNTKTDVEVGWGKIKVGTSNKEGIVLNKGDDPVVRWSELNTELQKLVTALNTHYHEVSGSITGAPKAITPTPTPVPGTFTLDISSAASEVLAVPKASTGGA